LLCPTKESDFAHFPQKFCGEDKIDRFFFAERKEFEENLFVKTYKFVQVTEPQQIAKGMLRKNLTIDMISEVTGLSLTELEALQKNL